MTNNKIFKTRLVNVCAETLQSLKNQTILSK